MFLWGLLPPALFHREGVFVTKIEVIVALIILLIVSSEGRKSWIAIREIGAGFGL